MSSWRQWLQYNRERLAAVGRVYFFWCCLLAFILGVAAARLPHWQAAWLPWLLLPALPLLAAACLLRQPNWLWLLFLLLGLGWGGVAELRVSSFSIPPQEAVFFSGRVVEVLGREASPFDALAATSPSGYSFIMQGQAQNGWRGRLRIVAAPVEPKIGDRLQVRGLVTATSATYNLGLRANNYWHDNGVAAAVRPVPGGLSFQRLVSPYSPACLGAAVRQRLWRAMASLPPLQQALLKGIGFGETGMLTNGQTSVLQQSGIMHIFAVSGLHVGYVLLVAAGLLNLLNRWLPLPAWLRLALLALTLLAFDCVVGLAPSVLRATLMALIAYWGLLAGDEGHSCYALILAAFLLLLWQPLWLGQAGFLLSFLATAGIVCTAKYWRLLLSSPLFCISLAAQFMIMPLLAYFFNTVSLVGLLLSPLLLSGAGVVVILLLLAMPLSLLGLAYAPLAGAGLLAELMYRGAQLLAGLPHAFVYTLTPGLPALILYYLLLAGAYYLLARVQKIVGKKENRGF